MYRVVYTPGTMVGYSQEAGYLANSETGKGAKRRALLANSETGKEAGREHPAITGQQ